MLNKSRSRLTTTITTTISVALIGICAWGVLNRQYVVDVWRSIQFQPTSQVEAIAHSVDFTEKGKFYFYASNPSIDSAEDFNAHCQQQEAGSAILGCYSDQKVYIYDVPNGQLAGIKEVTAAHETLHAIWERMTTSDQERTGVYLEAAFKKINSPELNERMDYYARTEPGERTNELHSILATEYADLGPDLEAHYGKYFQDRTKVVALHAKYQAVFTALQKMSDDLSNQLKTLKIKIDQGTTEYEAESKALSSDVAALKAKSDTIDRTSAKEVNDYNAERQVLINRSNELEKKRVQINRDTENYNSIVFNYNQLVTSINTLTQSLDSTLTTPSPGL